ncbi:tetratricopeptide (TPR) repeat protein [Deinobacterium chartae]|uniref:Tetratricopeptide (TPR) repeat protein n=1 Tax=Deinobacterium chartae TaxID=521158 RepID=A0A841I6L5_9DEIO|nr:hypothetical protein [Deinobacterium chartae]MBB6099475.1 tetratricopeptide (TPR) repeat protein [Deinobacterium chartae]
MTAALEEAHALLEHDPDAAERALTAALPRLPDSDLLRAARLAWALGLAPLTAELLRRAQQQGLEVPAAQQAAALNRCGRPQEALEALRGAQDAWSCLQAAQGHWQLGQPDAGLEVAGGVLLSARRSGDAGLLIATVSLLGELHLAAGEPRAAVLALAEGLKVAELVNEPADPYLLAVLAEAQSRWGNARKGAATATKALARSGPRALSRVRARVALVQAGAGGGLEEAHALCLRLGWGFWAARVRALLT